jgi:uncharacterized pyridoxamine 5'-phosphate oxidase family protein
MSREIAINKTELKNRIVSAVLSADDKLVFRHFNNRRYYFYRKNENDLIQTVELCVHYKGNYAGLRCNTKSNRNEVIYLVEKKWFNIPFLTNLFRSGIRFDPTSEFDINNMAIKLVELSQKAFSEHSKEILMARKGVELAKNYSVDSTDKPFILPLKNYSYVEPISSNDNESLKSFYVYLFKALDMAKYDAQPFRIHYLLVCMIQAGLMHQKIKFERPVY